MAIALRASDDGMDAPAAVLYGCALFNSRESTGLRVNKKSILAVCVSGAIALAGCGESTRNADDVRDAPMIKIDGSSTVFPIAEAVAEEFQRAGNKVRVTVGLSGTGGGFKKLCRGEIDIANASRPILTEEMEKCRAAGIGYLELPVAFDAITVVVHPSNTWVTTLTIDDLKKMWEPAAQGTVLTWNQVRPEWPETRLMLFGPGADSGTFDYFTEAVAHKAKASRGDYTASEDDNVLVQGVENNKNALGYFGYAYYSAHTDKMRAVPIEAPSGAVAPSIETVVDGTYTPLSRPLFIYVSDRSIQRPEVQSFVEYYLQEGSGYVSEVGFISLPESATQTALKHLQERRVGTVFGGVPEVGVTIEDVLGREAKL
jgi:phosphate transport system substrate-binding protein